MNSKLKQQLQPVKRVLFSLNFWIILFIMCVVVLNFYQLKKASESQARLTNKSLPIQFLALQLATSMDEQKAALIRYLVEGDSAQKMIYESMESEIENLVREMIIISENPLEKGIIQQVDWMMDELDAGGRLVLSMDENVDKNYIEISEAIDDIDDLLDQEVVPYVDLLQGKRRESLEESTGELETGIQECLLALSEYIMQSGAAESRSEFLEARDNIQKWENVFIEEAVTTKERIWARMLNENMDKVILKADELMINYDRRMEEYSEYSQMEIDTDNYIEKNLLALGNDLVNKDIAEMREDKKFIFAITLFVLVIMIVVLMVHNKRIRNKEQQLRKIESDFRDNQMKAIIQSQENERARFAQDLHDSYGQLIAVLKLNLQSLERRIHKEQPDLQRMLDNSNSILENMSGSLREICFGLMPLTLKERGLLEALQELVYKINTADSVKIKIHTERGLYRLGVNEKISVFRICQEWLNNILKHSNANNVKILLGQDESAFELIIEDDGVGFDKNLLLKGSGYGWKNIQSRARLLGAKVNIASTKNKIGNRFQMLLVIQAKPAIFDTPDSFKITFSSMKG